MILRSITIFIFSVIIVPTNLPSQLLEDPRQHLLVLKGIDLTLQQKYDSAEMVFQSVIQEIPNHPAGYLYLAGMLQAKNTDFGDRLHEKLYDSLLNIVEIRSEPMIENITTAAFGYYYLGSAKAFRSYTKSENGNLPSGIYYGLSAGSLMEQCVEMDSEFIGAKNILGSVYYWRSKLAWIPFFPDRTEEGIRLIVQSFSHPYEKHLASLNLMVILTEEKRYAEAERFGLTMLAEYPENRLFLWSMMTVYEKWNKKKELHNVVMKLLHSTVNAQKINYYTEAMCRLKLAQYAAAEHNISAAKVELRSVIALKKYIGITKGDLQKKISQAHDLLETLEAR